MAKVLLDPITRIEGHLSIEIDVQNGKVVNAWSKGNMFRGYEMILKGRNPVDATQITQRISGVCSAAHGIASSKCLDAAFGIKANKNGRLLRNLILTADYLQSHILHFYHLCALDYVDITSILKYNGTNKKLLAVRDWVRNELEVKKNRQNAITAVAPFLPRYEGDFYIKDLDLNIAAIAHYLEALDVRIKAQQMIALFGGKTPHINALVPGGVTQVPTRSAIRQYKKDLKAVERFVNEIYANDVIAIAKAYSDYFKLGKFTNFLSYGAFEENDDLTEFFFKRGVFDGKNLSEFDSAKIREQVKFSRYDSGSNLHPLQGQTNPDPHKGGAYSWLKAPRYDGMPMEVGPLARVVISYLSGHAQVKKEVDALLKVFNADIDAVFSVLGRHASRVIECKLLCQRAYEWLDELEVDEKSRTTYEIPEKSQGEGLTDASCGALGHWINIEDKKIASYQIVEPATWSYGPRGDDGTSGPIEQALLGTPIADPKNPIEAVRVVHSFV